MRDTDVQILAMVIRMARLRERHLRQAAVIECEISTLHGNCRPEVRRTIDRLALTETEHLDCGRPHRLGVAFSKN